MHHDRDLAQSHGSKDIFLNILTTTGLVQRYVGDWAREAIGPEFVVRSCALRLGAPAHPYDTLSFTGEVDRRRPTACSPSTWSARCSLGDHVHRDAGGDRPMTLSAARRRSPASGRRSSPRSPAARSCSSPAEATLAALADAGLTPADVDGLVTFTMDNTSEIALARELGMGDLRFFSRINYGGGAACATVQQAAMAVATGVADVVVCYRGFNERSGQRFGQVQNWAAAQVNTNGLDNAWTYPHGLSTPAATVAMQARRYMHEYGATSRGLRRASPSPTASTPRPTRTRSSTAGRSRSRTTRPRG